MPLIRYEIGDYAIAAGDAPCACGRTLPTIGKIIGRGINLFRMPDGRLVSPWPLVGPLKDHREIEQFQIIQQAPDQFVVRYVSGDQLVRGAEEDIRRSFDEILAIKTEVAFERMASIERTAGGKFMTALSTLTSENAAL